MRQLKDCSKSKHANVRSPKVTLLYQTLLATARISLHLERLGCIHNFPGMQWLEQHQCQTPLSAVEDSDSR